jgi:hypothetical protein
MKAILESTSMNIGMDMCAFQPSSYSCGFICPVGSKWRRSSIRVSFEDMDCPLFPDIQHDDEFEIEINLKRIPKNKPEVKTFK